MTLALKVKIIEAQKWKEYLIKNNLFNQEYNLYKDNSYIYFPVKQKFEDLKNNVEFVDIELTLRNSKKKIKQVLKEGLTKEELDSLRTAHDIVGDIAILEIPKNLEKKERFIAQKLLETNKGVKTVLKKAGSHEGKFRTQKMKFLAGENKKETVYKENKILIELDVEKVYFSPRLSNERKRIANMIKPGEEVLVMFSGCAPYPLVFSKNSDAMNITGIEINPIGHQYALHNQFLNKAFNTILLMGDVSKISPSILKNIVGLKSSLDPEELKIHLKANPQIIELTLRDYDLFNNIETVKKTITTLKKLGKIVFLHMPYHKFIKSNDYTINPKPKNREHYNLSQKEIDDEVNMLTILGELCKECETRAIIHIVDPKKQVDKDLLIKNISKLKKYLDYFYFETLTKGFCSHDEIKHIGKASGIKNVCIDLAHLFIFHKKNNIVIKEITKIKEDFNTYFHIADNNGITHTCELGKGLIDIEKIAPLINIGVIEIQCADYKKPVEALNSWEYLNKFSKLKKYDRIVMPLPKSAGEFLDEALQLSKKGTIIHFYTFIKEENLDETKKKIIESCKKNNIECKILRTVKCGQQSPYINRVCVDFKIIKIR